MGKNNGDQEQAITDAYEEIAKREKEQLEKYGQELVDKAEETLNRNLGPDPRDKDEEKGGEDETE